MDLGISAGQEQALFRFGLSLKEERPILLPAREGTDESPVEYAPKPEDSGKYACRNGLIVVVSCWGEVYVGKDPQSWSILGPWVHEISPKGKMEL